jgi:4-azaleucine resistance transporter AzlC
MARRPPFVEAWLASIPVLFGYLPLGITFGVLFAKLGCPWWYAALSGLVVFAGAAQYLSIGLFGSHASLASVFLATLFLNLRHVFYGLSMFQRFSEHPAEKPYLIFGLTDETYSVLTARKLRDKVEDERFCLWLTALDHGYWVVGCGLGALLGRALNFDTKGLDFVLTALFVVLAIEQAMAVRDAFPFILAAAAAIVALAVCPSQFLVVSLVIVFVMLAARSARLQARNG